MPADPSSTLRNPADLRQLSGLQRAATLLLALGPENGAPIWEQLAPDEAKELSNAMAQLGTIAAPAVEQLLASFAREVGSISTLHGSFETTERLLNDVMPPEKVREIMEDIRGPAGRTMWDKLSNVSETLLAGYLQGEHPQTVAVVLGRLKTDQAARVLAAMPRRFAVDVVQRMLEMQPVEKEIVSEIESSLRAEFMANLSRNQRGDPHERMAELFNALDRATEEAMLAELDDSAPQAAERIRALMFTFADLSSLLPAAITVLIKGADKRQLALALKGASEEMRQMFLSTMTERAAKMLREDLTAMGPVRARDCEEAQAALVRLAKDLAERGEIMLVEPGNDDDVLIY